MSNALRALPGCDARTLVVRTRVASTRVSASPVPTRRVRASARPLKIRAMAQTDAVAGRPNNIDELDMDRARAPSRRSTPQSSSASARSTVRSKP